MQQLCLHAIPCRLSAVRAATPSTSGRSLACVMVPRRDLATRPPKRHLRTTCNAAPDSVNQLEMYPVLRAFLSVGVSIDDFKRAQRLEPELLTDYDAARVNVILDLLLNLGMTGSDIGKVLVAYPQAFRLSPDHHVQPVLDFLRTDVRLAGAGEVRALVTRFPAVLGMHVKGHLRPQVHYLVSLGVPPESLPALVLTRPLVLGPGIEPVVNFLLRRGVARSQMHRLLASYPLDYGLSLKGISGAAASGGSPPGGNNGGGRGRGRDRIK